jgi:hypothetical protein
MRRSRDGWLTWVEIPRNRRECHEEMVNDIKGAAILMALMIVAGAICKLAGWWPG